ncbi:MAG: M1 family metallopeptidase [Anaerolineae bacterium]
MTNGKCWCLLVVAVVVAGALCCAAGGLVSFVLSQPTPTSLPLASPTLTSVPTPLPTPEDLAAQAAVMVPAARGDLATLSTLPRYDIQVTVDVDTLTYVGQERLLYTNNEDIALGEIYLRLFPNARQIYGGGKLKATRVVVAGDEVEPQVELEGTALKVPLAQPLPPGAQVELVLDFKGAVPRDFGPGTEKLSYGIFNYADGVLALADWYPILAVYDDEGWNVDPVYGEGDAVYSDAAFYQVAITAPWDAVVVASGSEAGRRAGGEGAITHLYRSGPMRNFFVALSYDFRVVHQRVGDTRVNSYYLPGHKRGGRQALNFATDALEVYNEDFGLYPYAELDIIEVPLNRAAGVEYPGLILIARSFYLQPGEDIFFEFTVAHEVAHQWWYGVVGNDVIDEPWLDEALTNYSAALYSEALHGQRSFQRTLDFWQKSYKGAVERGEDDVVAQSLSHFAGTSRYGVIVYIKGALFFHALREEIGDEAYFETMRRYYQTYKYGIAEPEGLLSIAEEVSGRDLDELYRHWILAAEER